MVFLLCVASGNHFLDCLSFFKKKAIACISRVLMMGVREKVAGDDE